MKTGFRQRLDFHGAMQDLARATMECARAIARPGMELTELRVELERYMLDHGADGFWYYGIGAFVFSGRETAVSLSGRDYRTSPSRLGENDILTIDLSPVRGGAWGDYARTLLIGEPAEEWTQGLEAEKRLHEVMRAHVTPETTFDELSRRMNAAIRDMGYVNLDFKGNLGHTIELQPSDRIYVEAGNALPIGEGRLFTFEPHIARPDSPYGYKREDIYYFQGGSLHVL